MNRKLFEVTEKYLKHSTSPKYFASAQKRILEDWALNWGCCFPIGKRPMSPCGGWHSNDKTGHTRCGFEAPSFQVSFTHFVILYQDSNFEWFEECCSIFLYVSIMIDSICWFCSKTQQLFFRENKIEVAFTGGEGVDGKVFQFVFLLALD